MLVVTETATVRPQLPLALATAGFVVSACVDATSAVETAARHRFALTIVVLPRPGQASGLLRALARSQSGSPVVVVTPSRAPSDVVAALRSGARGYLPEAINPAGLSRALRCVLAGEIALPRQFVTALVEEMRRNFGNGSEATLSPLTMRELQVLALQREGLSNQEIAQRLCIAPATVRSHVSAIRRKLNLHGRRPLRAHERGATRMPGVDISARPIGSLAL